MRAEAVEAAEAADVVILMLGINGQFEDEGHDRWQIGLPGSVDLKYDHGAQLQLAQAIMALRKPTIAVVVHGGSLAIEPLLGADAIIDAHYPGEFGGRAIVDAIFGRANRWGRLSTTIYPASFTRERNMTSMDLRGGPGATYWYYKDPLFAFGAGESYTNFTFAWAQDSTAFKDVEAKSVLTTSVPFECTVTNTGDRAGDAVVLGFVSSVSQPDFPAKRLFDFTRVGLAAGESKTVLLLAQAEAFALGDNDGLLTLRANQYEVQVGDIVGPARGIMRLRGESEVLEDYTDYFASRKVQAKADGTPRSVFGASRKADVLI